MMMRSVFFSPPLKKNNMMMMMSVREPGTLFPKEGKRVKKVREMWRRILLAFHFHFHKHNIVPLTLVDRCTFYLWK
jgi:hypothetical protein